MEEEDEEEMQSQSQQGVCEEELEALVSDVVRYMLFKNFQQPGVPVKREELTQIVTKNYKQRNLPGSVIKLAQKRLHSIFGLELRELQKVRQTNVRSRPGAQGATETVREYFLRSNLPEDLQKEYVDIKETAVMRGLAVAIIAIIQLAGEKCAEENLWHHLQRLGVKENDEMHPIFGNIKQALEGVLKQRYIQKEKAASNEGDGSVYRLAEKALDEPVRAQVQNFISKVSDSKMSLVSNIAPETSDAMQLIQRNASEAPE